MLRILHLGKYYTPDRGGIETVVETLCRGERPTADTQALVLNKVTETTDETLNALIGIDLAAKYEPEKMVAIKQGGMMYHPAGLHHYDGAKDEDVIVQIFGPGPVQTIQTEVGPDGKPVQRGGGAGRAGAPTAPAPTPPGR